MNTIERFFLRAKHWQIFLLLIGVGFVGEVAATSSMMASSPSPEDLLKVNLPFGAVMASFMICFLGWFWSMGSFLSSIVPPARRLKMGFFRFALIYLALYVFVFLALFQSTSTRPALLAIIFPLHFFAMFCMFYSLYFVSKNLVMAETMKPTLFYDYAGPFFLIWFFPIGVWFTQPRINRLYERPTSAPDGVEPGAQSSPVRASVLVPGEFASGLPVERPAVYAGFWLRFAAAVIDSLIMFVPLCFLTLIVVVVYKVASAANTPGAALAIFVVLPVATIVAPSFYFAVLESSPWQATLGKMAAGLYICDMKERRISLSRAMGRTLAKYISGVTVGCGFIMCGFTKKKQALHNIIAGCIVLRRP